MGRCNLYVNAKYQPHVKKYLTEYKTDEGRRFAGPIILAASWEDAEALCVLTMPHVRVVGELIEILRSCTNQ